MNLYSITLQAHSGFRWLVLLLAVIIIIKSLIGVLKTAKYQKIDNIFGASFTGLMHLQFLLGIVLYFFLSPVTASAFKDFGAAMSDPDLRFWAVEHVTVMILAIVFAQIGRSKSKKAISDIQKFRYQLIFVGISFTFLLIGIPWDKL
ncbi:MAG: hypothetical protein ACI8QD_000689 [Cyclobacteriaceae bacterium]|jgi:hypothetical protein